MTFPGLLLLFLTLQVLGSDCELAPRFQDKLQTSRQNDCGMPECDVLSPAPPEEDRPEMNLFDLLSRGSEYLENYTDVSEAIVLLGNTGSGKSTLAQVVAGNLSKLHSVLTPGCSPVIIDDDNKIGLPSTKSKTLFPELILKPGSSPNDSVLPFYDYPGFDDTRGDVSDIAANFFMNQVTGKITNIKMLFLVIWGSVNFSDRLDFSLLATHATTFVKNLDNFTKSFGLVVTKVQNFNNMGRYVEDHTIITQIVDFLNTYKEELSLQTSKSKKADETIIKKILFVDTLLEQDPTTGNYSRIWFFRSPMECGQLSEHEMARDVRNNITTMIENLQFTRINITDFGFTIKSETKLTLANYTRSINSGISSSVCKVTHALKNQFFNSLIDLNNLNFTSLNQTMYKQSLFVVSTLEQLELNTYNSAQFSERLKLLWNELGCYLPAKFQNFMRWQEEYLNFFDDASDQIQDRQVDKWTDPVKNFRNQFFDHLDWYEFCLLLEVYVASYEFQSVKDQLPSKSEGDTWLDYIEKHGIVHVSRQLKETASRMNTNNLNLQYIIMEFALEKIETSCDQTLNAVAITGNFILANRNITSLMQTCENNITQAYIIASHTIYFDSDIIFEDVDVFIMAPIWHLQNNYLLLYKGADSTFKYPTASGGQTGAGKGGRGDHGCSGKPGNPGGSFYGIVENVLSTNLGEYMLSIESVGGMGGQGQAGGKGGNGARGKNAIYSQDRYEKIEVGVMLCGLPIPYPIHIHYGFSGFDGGDGGNGGGGGLGGMTGKMLDIVQLDGTSKFPISRIGGTRGHSGAGGSGGQGGAAGNGYRCPSDCAGNIERYCESTPPSNGRNPGKGGIMGVVGASSICVETPIPPRDVSKWSPIIKYITSFRNIINPINSHFVQQVFESGQIAEFYNLKALAEESLALANLKRNDTNSVRLRDMYFSLIDRLEMFSEENYDVLSNEHKKVLGMLLSSAFSSLLTLDKTQNLDVIVDVSYYFTIVSSQIHTLRTATALVAVHRAKSSFQENLKEKVDQALGFLEQIVTPAIEIASDDIKEKLVDLETQLVSFIEDTRLSLEEMRAKLQKANQQQGIFNILKIFNIITEIGSLFMKSPVFESLESLASKLTEKYSNQGSELERLKEAIQEAEKIVAELEEKRAIFDLEFQPLVASLLGYFKNVTECLSSDTDLSTPQLGIAKWQIISKLRDTKFALEVFADTSLNVLPLRHAFDQIHDALTILIDLYQMIDDYIKTQSLAAYIARVNSAILDPIEIQDPDLVNAVANFDVKLKENLLDVEVTKAIHAFKQWVFPFAKFYFGGQDISNYQKDEISGEIGDEHLQMIESLQFELEKYKALSVANQDTFIILTNFSSALKTSRPFFVWENENWKEDIRSLLSGAKVHFNADVTVQGFNGWEAIKFRLIEINFKLNNVSEEVQDEFDDIIDYFGVSLTHSGLSYYRFLEEYYVMTGANQTLRYNFERDGNGNRLGTNQVYEKFKNGDYLFSPFTLWTIQLINVVPTGKVKFIRNDISFERLLKFLPYMDLELVGMGVYVNGEEVLSAAGGDLMLDKYYEKDDRMRLFGNYV